MKEAKTNQGGITLVALVVTIVVLLILAGVTIALVMNNNSVISRAQDARDLSGEKSVRELVSVAVMATQADYFTGKGDFATATTDAEKATAAGTSLAKELQGVGLGCKSTPVVTIEDGVFKVTTAVTVSLNGKDYDITLDTGAATLEEKITVKLTATTPGA